MLPVQSGSGDRFDEQSTAVQALGDSQPVAELDGMPAMAGAVDGVGRMQEVVDLADQGLRRGRAPLRERRGYPVVVWAVEDVPVSPRHRDTAHRTPQRPAHGYHATTSALAEPQRSQKLPRRTPC